jgi:predicted amidophosphoribosyltransferase
VVSAWKEHGLRRAGRLAAEVVAGRLPAPSADVITHIPSDRHRALERGGHPAEALAAELAARWALPHAPLLARARPAPRRQAALDRAERLRNLRGAFAATAAPPSRVVLVDDVYTTGATADAAARALRDAGAGTVAVVTFARTCRVG